MRSGTTALFSYLVQHPQIAGSYDKEVHYFDWNYRKGEFWYRSHFPLKFEVKPNALIGEATPYYLYYPRAPKRIHALLPNAKLIAVLRNPTERAISNYFFSVSMKKETLPIMEAMQAEDRRLPVEEERILLDDSYVSDDHIFFSYKQRGLYLDQLERYWKYFDRQQIMILQSEELLTATRDVLKHTFEFLGVDKNFSPTDVSPINAGHNRVDVQPAVYQYLNEYFVPHNKRLYKEIGRDLGW
jgi:hypothetical protein